MRTTIAPGQVVLSGHTAAIERAVALVKDFGIKRGMLLPVSAPFHCPLMQPAADAMAAALEAAPPGPLRITLLANVTDRPPVTDPAEVRRLLVEQVTGRVRWRESMVALGAAGVEQFVELGGKVVGPMITPHRGRCRGCQPRRHGRYRGVCEGTLKPWNTASSISLA